MFIYSYEMTWLRTVRGQAGQSARGRELDVRMQNVGRTGH